MTTPKLMMILSENWTILEPGDLRELVDWAVTAEAAGIDGVMISEHIVLGPSSGANGPMANPRDYALPGNQDPATPWPSSLVLLSAIAARTTRIRLFAGAIIAPLRHPLDLARHLGTLDILSGGRLIVQPTVSWHKDEYDALGVDFKTRGKRLDEQLAAMAAVWKASPASFHGEHFSFAETYLEPKAWRRAGPTLWFGGETLHKALQRRLVQFGSGFHPLGRPSDDDLAALADAMRAAGRDPAELEMIGGTRGLFPDDDSPAELAESMAVIPEQLERGFTTFCIKPNQFIDDKRDIESFCRDAQAIATSYA
ncbi:MAG: TIGR03619 family F420-dependent LLM class oxidoreductase [Chromatiales bacterium]|nr:MAG: TIGR03619 family F420-dependent LLM class oxidoreductase [Chromatiales bacterium]